MHVTYNAPPLYIRVRELPAGDTAGYGVGGNCFLTKTWTCRYRINTVDTMSSTNSASGT